MIDEVVAADTRYYGRPQNATGYICFFLVMSLQKLEVICTEEDWRIHQSHCVISTHYNKEITFSSSIEEDVALHVRL